MRILKKFIHLILLNFVILTSVFFLIRILPGDAFTIQYDEKVIVTSQGAGPPFKEIDTSQAPHNRTFIEKTLETNLASEYFIFLKNAYHLNFGKSLYLKKDSFKLLCEKFPNTFKLALFSLFIALFFSIPLAIFSVLQKNKFINNLLSTFSLLIISIPTAILGPFLIYILAIKLKLLPVSGDTSFINLILPGLTLGIGMTAFLFRISRNSLRNVLAEDYIKTAKAKGLNDFQIITKHALKNAAIPIVAVIGLQFGHLLTGAVITETIFDWPGIGLLFYKAILGRDYPLIQVIIIFVATTYMVINFLTDISYEFLNPRIKK